MIEMTQEEIEYWNERLDDPLVGEPVIMSPDEKLEFEKKHPLLSLEDIKRILKDVQDT